jgi:hypothetical protein
LPTSCKALQRYDEPYNDSRNRYNDSLEHIDLSENSQIVTNVLQIVQRFGESSNDLSDRYNDSLECVDLSEHGQSVADALRSVLCLNESYNDLRIVITIPKNVVFNLDY